MTTYNFHHFACPAPAVLESANWVKMETLSAWYEEDYYMTIIDGEEVFKVVYASGGVDYTDDYSYEEYDDEWWDAI